MKDHLRISLVRLSVAAAVILVASSIHVFSTGAVAAQSQGCNFNDIDRGTSKSLTQPGDIHVCGKVDGGSHAMLNSTQGSIIIDGKVGGNSTLEASAGENVQIGGKFDQNSVGNLRAGNDIRIGLTGGDGEKKIDGGSHVTAVAGGSIFLGSKIDNGSTSVTFCAGRGIQIANKIDGGATVRLRTNTGTIHIGDKIDNGGTHVVYWPQSSLAVDHGIGGASVTAVNFACP